MMTTKSEHVLREALALTDAERAELAERLLSSLEPNTDEGVEAAWQAEVARRLGEVDSGTVHLVPWETVRDRLKATIDASG